MYLEKWQESGDNRSAGDVSGRKGGEERNSHNVPYSGLREVLLAFFHELVNIEIHVLKDEEKLIVLTNHLFELHNVWVVQLLERLQEKCRVSVRRCSDVCVWRALGSLLGQKRRNVIRVSRNREGIDALLVRALTSRSWIHSSQVLNLRFMHLMAT